MSTVVPLIDGWVGYSGGELRVSPDEPIDADHPLVLERPELFDLELDDAVVKRGRGRPRKDAT